MTLQVAGFNLNQSLFVAIETDGSVKRHIWGFFSLFYYFFSLMPNPKMSIPRPPPLILYDDPTHPLFHVRNPSAFDALARSLFFSLSS